jgi:phosphonate transport system substrate-binding protein
MNVYLGKSVAGVTWPPPWRAFQKDYPKETEALAVAWETPPLINNSVMIRDDVPASIRTRITDLLLKLGETPQGAKILADMETARFHAANDASYEVVAKYVERFEQQVRPVERK